MALLSVFCSLPHNICMHPDGDKVIVSDRENNRAQIFEIATGKCTQVIASHRCVAVCVDKITNNIFLAEQATHSSVQMGGYLGKVDSQREDLSGCELLPTLVLAVVLSRRCNAVATIPTVFLLGLLSTSICASRYSISADCSKMCCRRDAEHRSARNRS